MGGRGVKSRLIIVGVAGIIGGVIAGPWVAKQLSPDNATTLGYCVDPLKVAETVVLALRKQNKITVLDVDIRANTTSTIRRWPINAHQTLRATGTVAYQIDFNTVDSTDIKWDSVGKVLTVRLADPAAAPPIIDLTRIVVEKDGALFMWYTGGEQRLDASTKRNLQGAIWQRAKQDTALLMQARRAAKVAIARDFGLPLQALGVADVRINVLFPSDRS